MYPHDATPLGGPAGIRLSRDLAPPHREVKRKHLLDAGVAEVWLVDPGTRTIEVDDASGRRRASGDDTLTSCAVPGFELTPSTLFEVHRP